MERRRLTTQPLGEPPEDLLGTVGRDIWQKISDILPSLTTIDRPYMVLLCRSWETYVLADTVLRDMMFPEKAEESQKRVAAKASWRMALRSTIANRDACVKILGLLAYGQGYSKSGKIGNSRRRAAQLGEEVAQKYGLFEGRQDV